MVILKVYFAFIFCAFKNNFLIQQYILTKMDVFMKQILNKNEVRRICLQKSLNFVTEYIQSNSPK